MKLVFLGTTGYHPTETRQTLCLMIPELGILFDAGTGIFRARDFICTPTLDIFLTHCHLDHVVGLTFLFDVLHEKSVDRVNVYSEPEKLRSIEEHLFSPALFPVKPPYSAKPLAAISNIRGAEIRHFPLDHPGGAVGYRLECNGFSLALVTDTTASDDAAYIDAIRGVDLLVHECYFPDGWEDRAELTGHSSATSVARVATAADTKRLLLVHVDPLSDGASLDLDAMRQIFPNTELATDKLEVPLG